MVFGIDGLRTCELCAVPALPLQLVLLQAGLMLCNPGLCRSIRASSISRSARSPRVTLASAGPGVTIVCACASFVACLTAFSVEIDALPS